MGGNVSAADRHSVLHPNTAPLADILQVLVFQGLPYDAQMRLARATTVLEPRNAATLFDDGDESDSVYSISSGAGHVRIGVVSQQAKGMMVAIYRKGELFGEIGAIDGQPRSAAAVVEGNVRILCVRRDAFLAVLGDTPALGVALAHCLTQRCVAPPHCCRTRRSKR